MPGGVSEGPVEGLKVVGEFEGNLEGDNTAVGEDH